MISPYQKSLNNYIKLSNIQTTCNSDLSLNEFSKSNHLGQSASGMQFGIGRINNVDVFVKFFCIPCRTKRIKLKNGKEKRRFEKILDPNALEIGLTKLISSLLLQENVPT